MIQNASDDYILNLHHNNLSKDEILPFSQINNTIVWFITILSVIKNN